MKRRKITYNDTVKEAIIYSLLKLCGSKPLQQITISEIVALAGVSRSSFYRNFETKEQVLLRYIQQKYNQYFSKELLSNKKYEEIHFEDYLFKKCHFVRENSDFFTMLQKNNLLDYIFKNLEPTLSQFLSGNVSLYSPYHLSMFSGASAGFIQCWIDRKFQETEEDLIALLQQYRKKDI